MKTKDLFHIRWPHGKEIIKKSGYITTSQIAEEFPLISTLRPRIPNSDPTKEDTTTPRVCFSTTLEGARSSLGLNKLNGQFHIGIYKPVQEIEVCRPLSGPTPEDKTFYVHDGETWGEVWSLRPVIVELQKVIMPGELIIL